MYINFRKENIFKHKILKLIRLNKYFVYKEKQPKNKNSLIDYIWC